MFNRFYHRLCRNFYHIILFYSFIIFTCFYLLLQALGKNIQCVLFNKKWYAVDDTWPLFCRWFHIMGVGYQFLSLVISRTNEEGKENAVGTNLLIHKNLTHLNLRHKIWNVLDTKFQPGTLTWRHTKLKVCLLCTLTCSISICKYASVSANFLSNSADVGICLGEPPWQYRKQVFKYSLVHATKDGTIDRENNLKELTYPHFSNVTSTGCGGYNTVRTIQEVLK